MSSKDTHTDYIVALCRRLELSTLRCIPETVVHKELQQMHPPVCQLKF